MTDQDLKRSATGFGRGALVGVATVGLIIMLAVGLAILVGGPATPAQAQDPSPTEISDWNDLDAIRDDLDGDYVLVNGLNETTPGYDEVVANKTTSEFTETRAGDFTQGDNVTLTRTPLDTVSATDNLGASINVTITDAANGTVEFQEDPQGSSTFITFEYTTTEEKFVGFDPIGGGSVLKFEGTFDGQGHTISDLIINRPTENRYIGLFGRTGSNGECTNVRISGVDVTASSNINGQIGGLVGWNRGTVSNVIASVNVTGNSDVGGVVGRNSGTVSNSTASGNVTGNSDVGGVVGTNLGTVSNSTASGNVTSSFRGGGLVGDNVGTVSNSTASGDVTGFGINRNDFGGLVGFNSGTVSNSTASGNVTAGDNSLGGLVGWNEGTVSNSTASGNVTGNFFKIGGLVGWNRNNGTVSDSFAVGAVTGDSDVGGLVGELGGFLDPGDVAIVRDSYYNNQTTGQSAAVGRIREGDGTAELRGEVTGLETSQMQGESAETTMSALDFQNTWATVTDPDGYPVLQSLSQQEDANTPSVADYANENSIVDTEGLLAAIADWRADEIGTDLLREVITAWRSGEPVE